MNLPRIKSSVLCKWASPGKGSGPALPRLLQLATQHRERRDGEQDLADDVVAHPQGLVPGCGGVPRGMPARLRAVEAAGGAGGPST